MKKEKEQKPLPTFNLKEIEELKVPEINEEELRASEIEAKERKEAAQILAAKGLDIERKIREIEEFSIGHSIISRAVFTGLYKAVREMLALTR